MGWVWTEWNISTERIELGRMGRKGIGYNEMASYSDGHGGKL